MNLKLTGIPEKGGNFVLQVKENEKSFDIHLNLIDVEEIQQSTVIFFNHLGSNSNDNVALNKAVFEVGKFVWAVLVTAYDEKLDLLENAFLKHKAINAVATYSVVDKLLSNVEVQKKSD